MIYRFPVRWRSTSPYFDRLGTSGLGATSEIRDQKVQVTAVTKGIRSFTNDALCIHGD